MSYFEVYADGVKIYDPTDRTKILINPVVNPSLSEAGSFDFTIDYDHMAYNSIIPYGTDIRVTEDGYEIFVGRPLPPSMNLFRQKSYHCEGALAWLNDVIIAPLDKYVDNIVDENGDDVFQDDEETDQHRRVMYMSDYLTWVFQKYNSFQTKQSRKLILGTMDFAQNPAMVYDSDFKSALAIIREEILPYTGGYLKAETTDQGVVVGVYQSFESFDHTIKAGVNLMDFTQTQKPFYTAVMAKGGKAIDQWDGEERPVQTEYPIVMSQEVVDRYGLICAYQYFPECTNANNLYSKCNAFLAAQQFDGITVDASALDLHIIDSENPFLNIGTMVQFESPVPGSQPVEMMITSMEVHLDTGEKRVQLGDSYKTRLTQNWGGSSGSSGGGGIVDAWEHQVDGVTHLTGIVNFIPIDGILND